MKSVADVTVAGESARPRQGDRSGQMSVVVPVIERPADLADLYREYAEPLRAMGRPFEFIFVVEPWFRELTGPLVELAKRGEPIQVLEVGQAMGEASLVKLGAAHVGGEIILTLPAYHRVEAAALTELADRLKRGTDLVVARRWPRRDSWINRLQSWALHALLGRLAGGSLRDVACGVRVMRRELLDEIPLYGDFYRFLPLLALREGYRIQEVPCRQHPKDVGARVYSPGVYLRRLIDVLGLFFLLRFTEKPLRFFGLLGTFFAAFGGVVLVVLFVQRLLGQGLADRPLLLLGVLLLVLGVQAIALGLIGEIIVHLHAHRRRPYRLAQPPAPRP